MSSGRIWQRIDKNAQTTRVQRSPQGLARRQEDSVSLPVQQRDHATTRNTPYNPESMLALQRTIGNREAQRIIQAKLQIGPVNDKYEEEADRIACQVTRTQDKDQGLINELQQAGIRATPIVNRKGDAGFDAGDEFESHLATHKAGGKSLPRDMRVQFETKFGADFSQVRIHTSKAADELSQQIQARAFTQGNKIYFAAGQYDPHTAAGRHLIAHELVHTLQQTGGVRRKIDKAPGYRHVVQRVAKDAGTEHTSETLTSMDSDEAATSSKSRITPEVASQIKIEVEKLPVINDKYIPAKTVVDRSINEGKAFGQDLRNVASRRTTGAGVMDAVGGDRKERKPAEAKDRDRDKDHSTSLWKNIGDFFKRTKTPGQHEVDAMGNAADTHKIGVALSESLRIRGSVSAIISLVFRIIAANLDVRSAIASKDNQKIMGKQLQDAVKRKEIDVGLLQAVRYALEQKYKKFTAIVKDAALKLTISGLNKSKLEIGGHELLAKDPVSWAIAGRLSPIGAGLTIYRPWHMVRRDARRREMQVLTSARLYESIAGENEINSSLGREALKQIGLPAQKWQDEYRKLTTGERKNYKAKKIDDIMRRLKYTT
jgi:Domain of unknown function (DUF4157)